MFNNKTFLIVKNTETVQMVIDNVYSLGEASCGLNQTFTENNSFKNVKNINGAFDNTENTYKAKP